MLPLAAAVLGLPVDWLGWTLADWALAALLAGLEALAGGSTNRRRRSNIEKRRIGRIVATTAEFCLEQHRCAWSE